MAIGDAFQGSYSESQSTFLANSIMLQGGLSHLGLTKTVRSFEILIQTALYEKLENQGSG
jgi:hypothetical protein